MIPDATNGTSDATTAALQTLLTALQTLLPLHFRRYYRCISDATTAAFQTLLPPIFRHGGHGLVVVGWCVDGAWVVRGWCVGDAWVMRGWCICTIEAHG